MAASSGKAIKKAASGDKPGMKDGAKRLHGSQVHGGGRQALHPSAYKKG